MKAEIDREGCISCGLCIEICPQVFSFGEDGRACLRAEPTEDTADAVREAAASCPAEVIAFAE